MPRFHLSFDYKREDDASRTVGGQIVEAETFDDAVRQIARVRDLRSIHIRKRYFSDDQQTIDRDFEFPHTPKRIENDQEN